MKYGGIISGSIIAVMFSSFGLAIYYLISQLNDISKTLNTNTGMISTVEGKLPEESAIGQLPAKLDELIEKFNILDSIGPIKGAGESQSVTRLVKMIENAAEAANFVQLQLNGLISTF
ncbi:MAG: hypothetical protein LBL71_04665 [Endomicrobium sp.]|nr:hypothetical protein [Endomicrobium sp.]